MENKKIIIILVVIIVILAATIGFILLNSTTEKESTKIKITSDKEQYEKDGKLSIKLTDLNKTPISKEIVNITITNKKGKVVVDDVVKTDSKGKAKLDLDLKKGKYKVNVTYGGNENYTSNNTTQKLTIKEKVVVKTTSEHVNSEYGSTGQTNDNRMPEETRKIYAARQKAADDGIPMSEYTHSRISRKIPGNGIEENIDGLRCYKFINVCCVL